MAIDVRYGGRSTICDLCELSVMAEQRIRHAQRIYVRLDSRMQ